MATYNELTEGLRKAIAAGNKPLAQAIAAKMRGTAGEDYEEDSNDLGSAMQGFGQGATFGLADEVGAGVRAALFDPLVSMFAGGDIGGVEGFKDYFTGMGERYNVNLGSQRDALETARREDPWITGLSEVAGGLGQGGAGMAKAAAGRGLLGATGAGLATGAGMGAAAGYGYSEADPLATAGQLLVPGGEEPEEGALRQQVSQALTDAGLGAGIGGVFGAAMPAVSMGARGLARYVSRPFTKQAQLNERARREIAERIQEDLDARGITAKEAQQEIDAMNTVFDKDGNAIGRDKIMRISDIGSSTRDYTELAANINTRGGAMIRDELKERNRAQWRRMYPKLARATDQEGHGDRFWLARKRLVNSIRERSKEAYKAAYRKPVEVDYKIMRFLNDDETAEALVTANRLRGIRGKKNPLPDRVRKGQAMSTEDVDLIIRGWDQKMSKLWKDEPAIAKELQPRFDEFKEHIYKKNPLYGKARAQFSSDRRNQDAMDEGLKLFRNDADMTTEMLKDMTMSERAYFRLGALRSLTRALKGKPYDSDITKGVFNSPAKKEAARLAFGNAKKFKEFMDYVAQEEKLFDTYKAANLNSATARRLAQLVSGTDVGSELAGIFGYTLGLKGGGIAPAMVGHGFKRGYQALFDPKARARQRLSQMSQHQADLLMGDNVNAIMQPNTLYGLMGQGMPASGGFVGGGLIAPSVQGLLE